jgi:hypothetical protein
MGEPLSTTTSIIGIIMLALHSTRVLLEDLQGLKDAPKTITCLTNDVHSVYAGLELLHSVKDVDWESLGKGINH